MYSLTVIILLLTTLLLVGLTAVAWKSRGKQGADLFAILEAVSAVWASLTVLGLTLSPGTLRLRIWGATSGLSLLVVVLWFGFILSYTGRRQWLGRDRFGVLSLPLVVGAGVYLFAPTWEPLIGELSQDVTATGTLVTSGIGPLGVMLGAYLYAVFLLGLGLVVKTILEGSRLFVGQALALVVGSLVTITASVLVIFGIPTEGYPLTQMALGAQALLWGYAVFGQQLLQVVPAVAEIGEQAVFEDLTDGVLVVNEDGTVVRANPQLRSYLDIEDPTGSRIETVLELMDVETLGELPTRFELDRRTYRTDISEIRNWQGEPVGHTLVIRDISQFVTREQRLAVLNRILRHNVRNDMNVVLSIGNQLRNGNGGDEAESGEVLQRTARNLTRVSEKAIEIDRLFKRSTVTTRVHLPTFLEELLTPFEADYPEATVETSVGVEWIRTDPEILRKVLEEAVANALEHTGAAPTVDLTVDRMGSDIEVTVADDGPGIPDAEIEPIRDGRETALEHASSFGLWFINWGTQTLGGTVDIATDTSGTRVTLGIPEREQWAEPTRAAEPDHSFIS